MSLQISLESPEGQPALRCCVAECGGAPTHTPILRLVLIASDHVSRIALPAQVCTRHRELFTERFLTAARRASIEEALRSRGRSAPDWSRTDLAFL